MDMSEVEIGKTYIVMAYAGTYTDSTGRFDSYDPMEVVAVKKGAKKAKIRTPQGDETWIYPHHLKSL